ncbi:MAG: hypothetical protein AAF430_04320 [Myxococcota bacterium]
MDPIEIYGTLAVSSMALTYALEPRDPRYTALFAVGCAASAGYAVAIGSWPFAAVESLWAGIALRRYRRRISPRDANT